MSANPVARGMAWVLIFWYCLMAHAEGGDGTGLVARYALDDGDGAVARDSGAGKQDGRISGATWVQTDRGAGLEFDGRAGYVECGPGARLKLADKISVAAWIFPKGNPTGEPMIVGEGPEFWGISHYRGRVYFYIASGGNHCFAPVPFYRWSHVAGTFDGGTMRLYVDGDVVATRQLPPTRIKSGSLAFTIGGDKRRGGYFKGIIGDVRVYDRVLTEKEIAALALPPGGGEEISMSAQEREAARRFFREHAEAVAFREERRRLWLANRQVGVEVIQGEKTFRLSRICDVEAGADLLSERMAGTREGLWQLVLRRDQGRDDAEVTVTSLASARVSHRVEQKPGEATLRLRWEGIEVMGEAGALDVEVAVTVKEGDPLSRWRIEVTNRSKTYGLWNVIFPAVEIAPIGDKPERNFFAIGRGRGTVVKDPFNSGQPAFGIGGECNYPGTLNMQFQALYDASGRGLYIAPHDGEGYKKTFYWTPKPGRPFDKLRAALSMVEGRHVIAYRIGHYPANMGYPAEGYRMTYDVCIGPFRGDWYDACQVYRAWATRQLWCSRGPLTVRDDIPRWYKETPVYLSTMSMKGDEQVIQSRDRMLAFLRFIGGELPVAWYTWKQHFPEMTDYNKNGSPWKVPTARPYPCGNIHDGNYPALPALPSFAGACKAIADAGGHVNAYVCANIYDPGLNENAPLAAQAKPNAARDVNGNVKLAEADRVAWWMCNHTVWWQQRMAETVTELIKREHVGGIYFDTFYGGLPQCFDTGHGHSHGGGNDPYLGDRKLSEVVRGAMKKADPQSVMSGESPAETAIDLLDGFLYRWTVWPDMAPMFATVYGQYITRHAYPLDPEADGFYIRCAVLFTEGAQMGRLRLNSDDYLKDFDAGSRYTEPMKFLRKLARYRRSGLGGRYLAYGQLLRPIQFQEPDPMPEASYAEPTDKNYRGGLIAVPALVSGVFKADDGSLGVFIVNVTERPVACGFALTPGRYPVSGTKTYSVAQVGENGENIKEAVSSRGEVAFHGEVRGHDVVFLEVRS